LKKEANRPIYGQIPSDLLCCIKGGMIKADVDNEPTIKMTARDNKIRLDLIKPKNLTEDLLTQTSNHHRKLGIKARISNITDFAKHLRINGLTLFICYKGKETMVVGKDAKPKLSKLVTGSKDIQV
jgi:hypothetical protein